MKVEASVFKIPKVPLKSVRNIALGGFAAVVLTGFLLTASYVFWVTRDLPSYDTLAHYEPPITTRVYAGKLDYDRTSA